MASNKVDLTLVAKSLAKDDSVLEQVINKIGYCKIGQNDQWQFCYLIGLIIGQKIKFSEARKRRSTLYTILGGRNFTPESILRLTLDEWRQLDLGDYKKGCMCDVSNYFVKNKIQLNDIQLDVLQDIKNTIRGIGPWTVKTLVIEYGLNISVFPDNDYFVNKKIANAYNIKSEEVENFAERWGQYKGVVFWYFWKLAV